MPSLSAAVSRDGLRSAEAAQASLLKMVHWYGLETCFTSGHFRCRCLQGQGVHGETREEHPWPSPWTSRVEADPAAALGWRAQTGGGCRGQAQPASFQVLSTQLPVCLSLWCLDSCYHSLCPSWGKQRNCVNTFGEDESLNLGVSPEFSTPATLWCCKIIAWGDPGAQGKVNNNILDKV